MGIAAGKDLISKTGLDPNELDLIICATVTPDMMFPATANLIATGIGANNVFSYDLLAACSGLRA